MHPFTLYSPSIESISNSNPNRILEPEREKRKEKRKSIPLPDCVHDIYLHRIVDGDDSTEEEDDEKDPRG